MSFNNQIWLYRCSDMLFYKLCCAGVGFENRGEAGEQYVELVTGPKVAKLWM